MKKYLSQLVLVVIFFCCQKEEEPLPPVPCELENWGHVHVQNFQSDPYEIYFDGVLKIKITSGSSADLMKFPAGIYRVQFENERTGGISFINDFEVKRCQTNLLPLIL